MSYKLKEIVKKNSGLDLIERKELTAMAQDAGLQIIPRIIRYENIPGVIANVHYEAFSIRKGITIRGKEYSSLVIESTSPIYKINVDMGKLFSHQKEMYKRFGAYAAYDYTAVLMLHEIRHLWVAQEQLLKGMASDEAEWVSEMEAIQYPVDICNGRRRLIALREAMIDRCQTDTKRFYELEKRIYRAYKGGVN